jgi:hypothetical protein
MLLVPAGLVMVLVLPCIFVRTADDLLCCLGPYFPHFVGRV